MDARNRLMLNGQTLQMMDEEGRWIIDDSFRSSSMRHRRGRIYHSGFSERR